MLECVARPSELTVCFDGRYYLEFPLRVTGWDLTLRKGGKEGPVVSRITKSGIGAHFEVRMVDDNWTTALKRPKLLTQTHEFMGRDGTTKFKWSSDGLMSSNWTREHLFSINLLSSRVGGGAEQGY